MKAFPLLYGTMVASILLPLTLSARTMKIPNKTIEEIFQDLLAQSEAATAEFDFGSRKKGLDVGLQVEDEQREDEQGEDEQDQGALNNAVEEQMELVRTQALDRPGLVVTIESIQFPNVFLRLDGKGVTEFVGSGGGVVNGQYGAGPYEKFILRAHSKDKYTIESFQFPNVYLRMDGSRVNEFSGSGAGVVNAQYSVGLYERFRLRQDLDGIYTIESVEFPDVFLRIDGSTVDSFDASGNGVVNCQKGPHPYEKLKVTVI